MSSAAILRMDSPVTHPAPLFNVRTLPWIPLATGRAVTHVGLDEALTRAHQFDGIRVRDPLVHAGLNRFLVTVAALVARHVHGTDQNVTELLLSGYPEVSVTQALDAIDQHLWLVHPDTPFMQFAPLAELSDQWMSPAMLLPRTPGSSGKAWFDVSGDHYNPDELTPAQAALALVSHWAYGGAVNKNTVIETGTRKDSYKAGSGIGAGGLRQGSTDATLTFFRHGTTLMEFLLANTHEHWVTGDDTLPAWAGEYRLDHPAHSLSEWTYTGGACILDFTEETRLFTGAIRGGFPANLPGAAAKDAVIAQLATASRNDPTRVWVKSKKDGDPDVLFNGLTRTHSTAQSLRAWHVDGAAPHLPNGLITPTHRQVDVLELTAAVKLGVVDYTRATWFTIESEALEVDGVQKDLVFELANTAAKNPEDGLRRALGVAFPPKKNKAGKLIPNPLLPSLLSTAVGHLHSTIEPLVGRAVADIMGGRELPDLLDQIHSATLAGYDKAVAPFFTVRTLPQIASGRGTLGAPATPALPEDDIVIHRVGELINRIGTDTRYRVEVRQGNPYTLRIDSLAPHEQAGVSAALRILASNPGFQHVSGLSVPRALNVFTRARDEDFDGVNGVSARVATLTSMNVGDAATSLEALLTRSSDANIHFSFHDLTQTLRHWDHHDLRTRTEHRNAFAYRYFPATAPKRK